MGETIGQRLKRERAARDVSQRAVADLVGVGFPHISKIENDRESPSDELLARFAAALGLDADELILQAGRVPERYVNALMADPARGLSQLRLAVHWMHENDPGSGAGYQSRGQQATGLPPGPPPKGTLASSSAGAPDVGGTTADVEISAGGQGAANPAPSADPDGHDLREEIWHELVARARVYTDSDGNGPWLRLWLDEVARFAVWPAAPELSANERRALLDQAYHGFDPLELRRAWVPAQPLSDEDISRLVGLVRDALGSIGDTTRVRLEEDADDGGWVASTPRHPGCVGQGASRAAAVFDMFAAIDAIDADADGDGGETLGQWVARRRRDLTITQVELADLIDRSESWVSQVERGVRRVDRVSVLRRLQEVLGLPAGLARRALPDGGDDDDRS